MIASDDDRCRQFAGGNHVVEAHPGLVSFALTQPTDTGRKSLEGHAFLCGLDPAVQVFVLGKEVKDGSISTRNIGRVAGQRHPAERPFALTEQWPDIGGHETWEVEGSLVSALAGLVPDGVAVVEDLGAGIHEPDHRFDLLGHGSLGLLGEFRRIDPGGLGPFLHRHSHRQVGQWVVR